MRDPRLWGAPRFVVTGTGRSGTNFTSALLTAAGLTCGHEVWFDPREWEAENASAAGLFQRFKWELRRRTAGIDGCASWMAVPFLDEFDGTVIVQLRHPLNVIASLASMRFFSEPPNDPWRAFTHRYFEVTGDDLVDGMRWWLQWNGLALVRADATVRLEDIDEETLTNLLTVVNLPLADAQSKAQRAFQTVAGPVNTGRERGHVPPDLGWSDLPDGPTKSELMTQATKWGYAW